MNKWFIAIDGQLSLGSIHRLSRLSLLRLAVIGCLWCATWPQKIWAGEVVPEDQGEEQKVAGRLTHLSLEQLGNTEITSVSKEPVKITMTPAAIYVITQEDIRRSGASSLPELLRLVPGVEVARIDSSKWSLGVRGFGSRLSRGVLVLIDGRSVYTSLFAGVYWDVQDTLLRDIDRIEVIRGPGGTIWGANAVNGVINIITKRTSKTHGTFLSMGGGNVDQGFASFRYGAGNSQSFDYRIYGKTFTRGPEFHSDQGRFDDWCMGQAGFRTDWNPKQRDSFTLQGDVYKGEAGERVAITNYSPPSITTVEQNAQLAGGNLLGRWKRVLRDGSDVQVQAYYDRAQRSEASFGETRDTFDLDFLHHLTWQRQDVLWGAGARFSPGSFTQAVPTVVFTPHVTDKLYSVFLQDQIAIVNHRLWLTLGSKFLHNNFSGFELQPTARLLWVASPKQTIWTAVTRAVRTPSRVEEDLEITALVAPNPPIFLRATGDGQFSSERLVGYEIGYRNLLRSNFYLDIATFYNNYDRLLSIEPGTPFSETSPSPSHVVLPYFLRNGLTGATRGIEIAPDWRPSRWWRLQGSYSYLHLDLLNKTGSRDPGTAASTEGSSPAHQFTIQSFLDLPKNLTFEQTYRYVSALPSQRVPAYETADLRLGWHFTRLFELSWVGRNLLQPHHAESAGDPGSVNPQGLIISAERLRGVIAESPINITSSPIPVTISVGLASVGPGNLKPIEHIALVQAADSALYRAKAKGRNRVEIAELKVAL